MQQGYDTELTGQTGAPDWSDRSSADWLQQRIEHYQDKANDMCEAIEDLDDLDKLGQGFMSTDPLEKVDIGDGSIPKPTFVNANLSDDSKADRESATLTSMMQESNDTEPTVQTGASDRSNANWLQHRIEHYRDKANDTCKAIEDFDDLDKLGQGFMSADPLEKVDIGDGSIPRPTFVNANLSDIVKLI